MMFPWLSPKKPTPKDDDEAIATKNKGIPSSSSSNRITRESTKPGYYSPQVDTVALVTGACGLCGARLVELLLERGTHIVIAVDIIEPNPILQQRFRTIQQQTGRRIIGCYGKEYGDITNVHALQKAFTIDTTTTTTTISNEDTTTTTKSAASSSSSSSSSSVSKVQIVYHIAALVGPFYDTQLYYDVNVKGTQNLLEMCRLYHISKFVYSSSPGTRFTGADIEGLSEEQLPIPKKFLAIYAETKAYGEMEVTKANNNNTLLTISVAPHQIYGPYDNLFLSKFLEVCSTNRLRIFGTGQYMISICYVDNYCHGLMCGADTLYPNSTTLSKFYIITDGNTPRNLWNLINEASIAMGFVDLHTKFHLPIWLLYIVATIGNIIGYLFHIKFKLNYFTIRMSTMHRYFDISNAMKDLQYEPVVPYEVAWPLTIQWFQQYWLPTHLLEKNKNIKKIVPINNNTTSTGSTTTTNTENNNKED